MVCSAFAVGVVLGGAFCQGRAPKAPRCPAAVAKRDQVVHPAVIQMSDRPICPDLGSADFEHALPASDEEQVMMVVEVGLVAALLDGKIPPQESEALVTAIRLLPGLRGLTDEQVNLLLTRAGERTRGGDAWLCEVAHRLINPGLRRVAFRMASMFCSWDGVITEPEQGYLDFLAKAFGFSPELAHQLFAQATGHHGTASLIPPPPSTRSD
jgi:tellurite resistance protein